MTATKFTNEDSFTSSDSEDIWEIFYSSSSHDRSSIGSIPWAEDAIKQNHQEWERVQRMFYGEEHLPEEPLLRNEILEWNKVFPHLRVNGRKIDTSRDFFIQSPYAPNIIKEEVISIHPSRRNKFDVKYTNDLHKYSARSIGQDRFDLMKLNNYLEKDLRISSVPMISKRAHNIPKLSTAHIISKPVPNISKQSPNFRKIMPSKSSGSLLLNRSNFVPNEKPSNSATILRMPPILIVPPHMQQEQSSATIKRNPKATFVLPAINLNRVEFSLGNAARSATVMNNKSTTSHVPFSASKIKFSK